MAATLFARQGDPQALKPAAAAAGGVALARGDAAAWKRLVGEGEPPALALVLSDGSVLREPNAMARWVAAAAGERAGGGAGQQKRAAGAEETAARVCACMAVRHAAVRASTRTSALLL